ncbi:hypothetical protein [Roseicitreum antarcticum]|uniref:hypothetical protein n=1 Tax=Roseicitreum antarcticum TaxID=564137 RepID=UPI000B819A21|nr:hypothetical protein [Roseicitreum antarcticum]
MKKTTLGLAMLAAVSFSGTANAQSVVVDQGAIFAACSGAATSCQAVVAAQIARLRAAGLTQVQVNAQIAVVASSVVSASASATTPAARAAVSAALTTAAGQSSDATQRASITTAATNVSTGTSTPGAVEPAAFSPA